MNAQQIIDELQSLDAENPGNWPLYARIGAAVLLAIAVMGGGFWYMVKPKMEELKLEQAKEPTLKEEFERKQRKVAALDAYKEQLEEIERSFGAMLRQLPSKSEVANLLNDISQTRVASSLDEELFKPASEQPKDFYVEIPNQIIVTGTYHEMGTFVSGVAALPRIVTIDDVNITVLSKGAAGQNLELRMQALAKTYRYLDDEEMAARAPKKPAARGRR